MLKMLKPYFRSHKQSLFFSLQQLKTLPVASFILIVVVCLAFSLPISLWVISNNAKQLTNNWQRSAQISIFLDAELSDDKLNNLLNKIRNFDEVDYANYISPARGLMQLEEQTGMDDVSLLLAKNPLPAVIELHPKIQTKGKLDKLIEHFEGLDGISQVKIDMQWVMRLKSMLDFAAKAASGLMVILCFAVILVVGNTIRLTIVNKQKEIEVLKLVGATNAYIRRPFLYFGFIHGLLGALLAWVFISLLLIWLQFAVSNIAKLYYTHYDLAGLSITGGLILLFLGSILGILGAFISVARQVRKNDIAVSF